ncbi:glycoside hydrolase family 13 protein [soil metagenome]
MQPMPDTPWWRETTCYQIYLRSFADSDGDGVGDLAGATSRLPYLADLGVDAVWLTPFYPSPQADHGYDVTDYCDVDALFGDLAAFDALLARAHGLGLKVMVDIVPNHSSDQHAWFQAALAAAPGSRERARYLFRDGRGPDGAEPPNNWRSTFGGPAWTRVPDGQWYLHLFDTGQPDFDWTNPEVADEFDRVLRFWLDRGVDGFRIDVAHGMAKADGLPDLTPDQLAAEGGELEDALGESSRPYWDQPGVHDIYRRWHRVLADYDGDRMAIAEAWVSDAEAMARYLRPDELQQAFNFHWLMADWSGDALRAVIEHTFRATRPVGAWPTWVQSNHDVVRATSRLGTGAAGLGRARSGLLAMLALPGSTYLYQGEELGLPQVDVAPAHRQDPAFHNGRGTGRDGCRVPLPWTTTNDDKSAHGFSPAGAAPAWLPQPAGWGALSVQAQQVDTTSTLAFVRTTLRLRRELLGSLGDEVELPEVGPDALVIRRPGADGRSGLVCVVGCGTAPVPLAPLRVDAGSVLGATGDDAVVDDSVQPDRAGWFRTG